jgi:hypothetical protein
MDAQIISWIANGLLGVVMMFMKMAHDSTREDLKNLKQQVDTVKEKYLHKDDFKDFKEELWARLDDVKTDVKRALQK